VEARTLARERLIRLAGRAPWIADAQPRSEGEVIAMSWLCEMSSLAEIARRCPQRAYWVDFDTFLLDPAAGLSRIARALGAPCHPSDAEALVAGPIMRQYSKAPEHPYDAALRREVMQAAEWEHSGEIRSGMTWLAAAANRDPYVARVIDAAGAASR
jgi:hypothetical protein